MRQFCNNTKENFKYVFRLLPSGFHQIFKIVSSFVNLVTGMRKDISYTKEILHSTQRYKSTEILQNERLIT